LTDAGARREIDEVERRFWQGVTDTSACGFRPSQPKSAPAQAGTVSFDLARAAPALCDWLDGHRLLRGRALVPGCGRGHDVIELARRGFEALGVDFARTAIRDARALAAKSRVPARFLERDLFSLLVDPRRQEPWAAESALEEGSIDLWWENTCYCAVEPSRRDEYASIAARLVRSGGTLLFLAFPVDRRGARGSPFPIRAEEIARRFAPRFVLRTLAPPPRPSSPGRLGRELLAVLERT
jgi:SAM-dependent methyltransferase